MSDDTITFLPLGAILQSLPVGGVNIVQGFPTQELYESHNSPHFGATIGRVANRISKAEIGSLNRRSYALQANEGPNSLHGGEKGWGKKVWDGPTPVGTRAEAAPGFGAFSEGGESVSFSLVSPDGDAGFPGTVEASVVYTAGKQAGEGGGDVTVLGIEYAATLVGGADETVVNMTNHSYFNLTGGPTIDGTQLELLTNSYLPVDAAGIPTGGPQAYSKLEGGKPFVLGAEGPDVDDCFIVNSDPKSVPIDTRDLPLKRLVAAYHPDSKIHLEVYSAEPAFQFYTGALVDVPAVGGYPARGARAGFCVEPSRWVNAPNVPEWKDMVLLKKGQTYGCRIVYKAWKD